MDRRVAPRAATYLASLALGLALAGCGGSNPLGPESDERSESLADVGEMLRLYQLESGQAPRSFDELRMASMEMAAPEGFAAIFNGDVVVRYGATLPDLGEEPGAAPDGEVIAYVKEAPEQGGPVLLLNRSVQIMTAEEFAAAPKAGTEPR